MLLYQMRIIRPPEPRVLIVLNSRYVKGTFIRKNYTPKKGRIGMLVIETPTSKLIPFSQVLRP